MCCKRQAAWRLNCVVLVIPLGHMLGNGLSSEWSSGCCDPQAMILFCICNRVLVPIWTGSFPFSFKFRVMIFFVLLIWGVSRTHWI